jgi:carbohydrate diacid regulator
MISSQVIKTSIDELKTISKIDLGVWDLEGNLVAATFEPKDISPALITGFLDSPADSQVI